MTSGTGWSWGVGGDGVGGESSGRFAADGGLATLASVGQGWDQLLPALG